jgi:hypothetical protein
MTQNDNLPTTQTYSTLGRFVFWLLWLMGLGVCLLFVFFSLIIVMEGSKVSPIALWDMLIVGVEAYLLLQSFIALFDHEKPMSALLLRVAFAAIGLPLIAFGGCSIWSSFAPRLAG